jgi:hypothetical protein
MYTHTHIHTHTHYCSRDGTLHVRGVRGGGNGRFILDLISDSLRIQNTHKSILAQKMHSLCSAYSCLLLLNAGSFVLLNALLLFSPGFTHSLLYPVLPLPPSSSSSFLSLHPPPPQPLAKGTVERETRGVARYFKIVF